MNFKLKKKKLLGTLLTLVFCLSALSPITPVKAATITGNDCRLIKRRWNSS